MTSAVPTESKKSVLPGVALGFAIVSLCVWCLWPVGIVLSIIAMVRTGRPEYASRRGLAVAALITSVVSVVVGGIGVAIAIPNFIRFQSKAKQAECKGELRSLYTSVRTRQLEDAPVDSFQALDFQPLPTHRYAYVLRLPDAVTPVGEKSTALGTEQLQAALAAAGVEPGVKGTCPDCSVTIACVGNVDQDATLDVWSVSTAERTDPKGNAIAAGTPFNHLNDVQE